MTPDKHKAMLKKVTDLCDDAGIDMAKGGIQPNYFIAIRLSDPIIRSKVKIVQDAADERLKPALVPLKKLHLSLLAIRLKDEKEIEEVKKILQQMKSVLPNGAFTIKCKGLDYFRYPQKPSDRKKKLPGPPKKLRKVLYVKPFGEELGRLQRRIRDVVRDTFKGRDILPSDSDDEDKEWIPHIAVIRLKDKHTEVEEIPEKSFKPFLGWDFGEQQVSSLFLCSIGTTAEDGFYKTEAKIDFEPARADDEIDNLSPH